MNRQEIARVALRAAIEARRRVGVDLHNPLCIYDFVERLGVRVWFVGGASFAGIYAKGHNQVFVPSERPMGRKAFTCAHELAHWWFKHGTRVEQLDFDRSDHEVPEEILANTFAAFLLMPRHAVVDAFKHRGLKPQDSGPIDYYGIACQLGVGFETLLKHMRWSLNMIEEARLRDLLKIPPKEIRRAILGHSSVGNLILAGDRWRDVSIDLEVGDVAVVPYGVTIRGEAVREIGLSEHGVVIEGQRPGIAQCIQLQGQWAAMVRVCRKQFTGLGAFRHLEETDDENE